jgi:hypothetical protein
MYQKYYTKFFLIENLVLEIVDKKPFIETKLLIFYYQIFITKFHCVFLVAKF